MRRGPYKTTPPKGTVADLVMRYRRSPRVLGWAPSTAAKFDKILGRFMAMNRNALVSDLRRGDIIAMRDDMASTPGEANNWLKVISGMLDYAADIEMIQFNPARGIKKLPPKHPDGFRMWREDEIAAFLMHYEVGDVAHTAFTLALCTGAAVSDLVSLGWQNVEGASIRYRRTKTGSPVRLPILPPLAEVLATLPRERLTFLETIHGTRRSSKSLTGDMTAWVRAAGLGERDHTGHMLSLHGLRKALGRRMAESGCSPHEIMAVLGHASISSAEVYTRQYDRERAAESAAEKMGNISGENLSVVRLKTSTKTT